MRNAVLLYLLPAQRAFIVFRKNPKRFHCDKCGKYLNEQNVIIFKSGLS